MLFYSLEYFNQFDYNNDIKQKAKNMDIYTSTDAKREFGELLLKSQKAPIVLTKNGKAVAVLMSQEDYDSLKLKALRGALIDGEESGKAGTLNMEDIKQQARMLAGVNAQD